MTIIFFTIEAGLAHIIRCLAVAEELAKREHKVIFTLSKNKQYLIKNKNIEVVSTSGFFSDEESVEKIKDPAYLTSFVLEQTELLEKIKPDIAVIDYSLSAIISCKILEIPSVFITNSDGLPFKIRLPSFGFPKFLQILIHPLIQILASNFKDQYLNALIKVSENVGRKLKKSDLLDMTYIIPEPKEYFPTLNNNYPLYNVGSIWWNGFDTYKPSWLNSIEPDGKTIYLTFGGTGYDSKKLIALSELLVKKGYRVIVSSSNIADPKEFKKIDNLYVEKFLPGFEICQKVDLVVCHGGIGTMAQASVSGKPVVAIPFNPDQYIHAFRFEDLGLGKCVPNINLADLFKLNWEKFEQRGRELPIDRILSTVEQVLREKDNFKDAINKYGKKFSGDGSKKAAEIIEGLV